MPLPDASSSLWNAVAPPAPALHALQQDMQVDCAIVGGGFTGLNAAWHLMKRGLQVCVLEAHEPGWGASGRNGGMAVLRYKHGWSTLSRKFGDDVTRLLYRLVHQAVDGLEANVQELGLDGGFKRHGHITAAHTVSDARALSHDIDWLKAKVADMGSRLLSESEMAQAVGTSVYKGGYHDAQAAGINPLAYARELAAALMERGLPLFGSTPVLKIEQQDGGYRVHAPGGTVRAPRVIVATNAYTSMHAMPGRLARRVIPVTTSVIATRPVPDDIYSTILPKGELVTDTRHLVNYFRRVPGGRILFGGRGSLTGHEKEKIYDALLGQLHTNFPQLRGVPIEYRWSGRVAVTLDDFPHVGSWGKGAYYAMGYGGRGVALTHLLGRLLAGMVVGEHVNAGPMGAGLAPVPLHGWRLPAMNVVASYYRLRDLMRV